MDRSVLDGLPPHCFDRLELEPTGRLTVANTGLILEANAAAGLLLGCPLEALLDHPFSCFVFDQDRYLLSPPETDLGPAAANAIHRCEARLIRCDGALIWTELTISPPQDLDSRIVRRFLFRDISNHKQAEAIIAARLRLLRAAGSLSLNELLQTTLDEAEALTGSSIGFCHFLGPDQLTLSLQAWSSNTLAGMCQADSPILHYPVNQAGVWADCLRERRPVIHNDYASLPHRHGLPPGHPPIGRELVVPILRGEAIVAVLGVGNKPSEYTTQDVAVVATLADLAWDIAERRRVEEILRESEERHRLMFEAAADALFLIDAETLAVVEANTRALELYGYSRDELSFLRYPDIIAESGASRDSIEEVRADATGLVEVPLRWHHKKDGALFPAEITARTLPLQSRQTIFIAVRDISARKATEAALRASEEQRRLEQEAANTCLREQADNLASIYQALDSVGLIVTQLGQNDARIIIFNSGAENMFGWTPKEAVGQSIALIYPPESVDLIPLRVEQYRHGRSMQSFDMILIRRDGERFSTVVSVHPFDCRDGVFRKAIGVFRDISEIKRIQTELEKSNQELERRVEQRTRELQETQKQYLHAEKLSAIGKLSASIAHEFNNPLQGILAILKGLKKRAILEEEDRALLDAAIGESDRIKELIRSLQDFNRPTSGRNVLMDVHKALDSILLLHRNDFKNKRITLKRDYAERLPQIMAVPDQIKQVFLNLLTNAADACQRPGGVISVHTRQQGDRVEVVISDTGIGIRPEDMELIFQPFYTTKPEVKGTGLGLSVSYGIIKSHDGEIRVTSRPGEGATFTVVLPVRIRPATGESGSITMAANEEPLNKQEDQDQTEGAKWTSTPEP